MANTFKIRAFGEQYNASDTRFGTKAPASGQVFKAGAPVVLGSGGEISEIASKAATEIYGVVTADADSYDWAADTHGKVLPKIPVALAGEEFHGTLLGTFANADIGGEFGLSKQGDTWVVDKSETTDKRVVVTGIDPIAINDDGVTVEVKAGDINVPISFMFLPAYRQVN